MLRAYGDGNLFGEPYGEGPVRVVWLHGWGRQASDFSNSATTLAGLGFASVAFDLPGFGSSPAPDATGGAAHYADILLPALAELAEQPLVLVGHSFGGRVATIVAARHPELLGALVLTGVPLLRLAPSSRPPLAYRTVRWLHRRGLVGDRRVETARQKYGSSDYRNSSGVMRDILVQLVNEDYAGELAAIATPVSLLWGANDSEVPVDVAERASALLAGPHSLQVIEGVGHLVPTEAPDELVTVVRSALS